MTTIESQFTVLTIISSCELIPDVLPCMPASARAGIPGTLIIATRPPYFRRGGYIGFKAGTKLPQSLRRVR